MKAGILGIGSALPEHVVTNAHFVSYLDTSDEWIVRRTGISERRHLNGALTLTDLAVEACASALEDAGRDAAEVDHVIVATFTPDRLVPGMAPMICGRIGATAAAAVDINAACVGFIHGVDQAASLIETGRAKLVLVVGAEALSRVTDFSDRGTAILFADGAGAVVLGAEEGLVDGCPPFFLRCDGVNGDLLYAERDDPKLRMSGQEVYRHAVDRMVEASAEALRRTGLTVDEIDLFVVHQANGRIVEAAARRLGLTAEKVFSNIATTANTSSASIPLALHQAEQAGRLKPGARVVLAAFAAGFVWGAGVITWKEPAYVAA